MTPRRWLLALPACALAALGAGSCPSGGPGGLLVVQQQILAPGYVEPHTPGSGVAGVEMAASANVQSILGATPDLNRVSYLRTYLGVPGAPPPRAILIAVPGFLSGAGGFTPLAKDLVAKFNGGLEVWTIDRRPNQLEDRRGSFDTQQQLAGATTPAEVTSALERGVFFYLPETALVDTNGNGVVDPPTELPDALGVQRPYVRLAQDDMRYAAYWGLDTNVRDWRTLVDAARAIVGPQGLVLFAGHSFGTYYASAYAAYDFDPDPDVVDAGYAGIDGIVLLEGGGASAPAATTPTLASYQNTVANLATPGGPDVFLQSFQGLEPAELGPAAELAGIAGIALPLEASIMQRTTLFRKSPFSLLFTAPTTNRGILALFFDDDYQPFTAFRSSMGFTDDGLNTFVTASPPLFPDSFYIAGANAALRQWKDYGDPTLPTCPPATPSVSPGCAIRDRGPRPAPTATPRAWGLEREVTSLDDVLGVQYAATTNFVEWYYLSGRTNLDRTYASDSSALVAESVAATGSEGPLVVTQNANVDVPVICIGGSNGLAPLESSFATYLGSIATPAADKEVHIIEGYAHADLLTARDNETVPLLTDWVNRLQVRKLLGQ